MKLRSNTLAVLLFLVTLAVFAAALRMGHHGGGYLKGFSNGG
jgi:hypothetical protein